MKNMLFRFIDLVDGKEMVASVRNQDGDVISLPPITNGEKSKVRLVHSQFFFRLVFAFTFTILNSRDKFDFHQYLLKYNFFLNNVFFISSQDYSF